MDKTFTRNEVIDIVDAVLQWQRQQQSKQRQYIEMLLSAALLSEISDLEHRNAVEGVQQDWLTVAVRAIQKLRDNLYEEHERAERISDVLASIRVFECWAKSGADTTRNRVKEHASLVDTNESQTG